MRPRKDRTKDAERQDRDFVTALARGLELLRAFRREGEALGNGELAERTGLSRSTVSRLAYTLNTSATIRIQHAIDWPLQCFRWVSPALQGFRCGNSQSPLCRN